MPYSYVATYKSGGGNHAQITATATNFSFPPPLTAVNNSFSWELFATALRLMYRAVEYAAV